MLTLLNECKLVVTDSGGLQKEAFFFRKFCITTRDETEWVELVTNKYNFICGADSEKIIQQFNWCKSSIYPEVIDLYGNGNACKNICKELANL